MALYYYDLNKYPKLTTNETSLRRRWTLTAAFRTWVGCFAFASLALFLSGCRKVPAELSEPSRSQVLPAFVPTHLPVFDCSASLSPSKPVDLEAKAWFDEATALLASRGRIEIDSKRVELLKKKAAARHYWPAVKESILRSEGKQKVVLIERAMSAGEPEAYFMMGTLYMKGEGVDANQAKAHAFWYRAALMGDVRAMVEVGVLLSTKQNNTIGWEMVNIPVATSILQCAMKKGYGDAAVPLREIVSRPRKTDGSFAGDPNDTTEALGLAVLQEGVKLGSREAANELASHYEILHAIAAENSPDRHSYRSEEALRARYYRFLQQSLDETTPERLPNLDAAVPLPPAQLPEWRDKEDRIVGLWEAATASTGQGQR